MRFSKSIQSAGYTTIVAAFLTTSAAAFASGNHAGGHDESPIGKPGLSTKIQRTITIEMSDNMRYSPENVMVNKGETIRFVVKNVGQVRHELSLGTPEELAEHLEQMKKFPEMEHEDPNAIRLAPGKSGEIVWKFTNDGVFKIACLVPGHYDSGMHGDVTVAKK